ncbi:hypothetical protein CMV_030646 [Castanea mollissima]|uniref:Uncharacterized protein n=1 Tax=Castanea mollissima TaxID=60419 RepID=A0A8J4Q5T3_9ROSI|nr:hypothetical protein CMV_030646 [Castanea mollissima]
MGHTPEKEGTGVSSGVNFAIPIDTVVRTVPYLIVYGTSYRDSQAQICLEATPNLYFGKPSPQSVFKIWVSHHGDLTSHNQAFKLRFEIARCDDMVHTRCIPIQDMPLSQNPHLCLLSHHLYRQAQVPTSHLQVVPSDTSFDYEFAILQSKLQQILSSHAIEPNKTWGTLEKWVLELELKDGRQVVVPIEIKSQLIESALVSDVDVGQRRELINPGNRLQIIKSNSEWDTVLVVVEDVDSDCPSEVAVDLADSFVCQHSLEPLSVTPLAMSSSMEAPVIRDRSDRVEDDSPQMSQGHSESEATPRKKKSASLRIHDYDLEIK